MDETKVKKETIEILKEKYGENNVNSKEININHIVEICNNNEKAHLELIMRDETLTLITYNESLIEYLKTKFKYYDSEKVALWINTSENYLK